MVRWLEGLYATVLMSGAVRLDDRRGRSLGVFDTYHTDFSQTFTQQNSTFMGYILHKKFWNVKGGFGSSNVRRQGWGWGRLIRGVMVSFGVTRVTCLFFKHFVSRRFLFWRGMLRCYEEKMRGYWFCKGSVAR